MQVKRAHVFPTLGARLLWGLRRVPGQTHDPGFGLLFLGPMKRLETAQGLLAITHVPNAHWAQQRQYK